MKYPDECPVFEVVHDGPTIKRGAIVEGFGPYSCEHGTESHNYIGVRLVDINDACPGAFDRCPPGAADCARVLGFWGAGVQSRGLRPLTPAAKAMLDLVEGRQVKVPAAVRDAWSPVFRVVGANVHRIPIGTLIDAGVHMDSPDWGVQTDSPVYGYSTALGLPFSAVAPVNAPARSLFHRAPVPGPASTSTRRG